MILPISRVLDADHGSRPSWVEADTLVVVGRIKVLAAVRSRRNEGCVLAPDALRANIIPRILGEKGLDDAARAVLEAALSPNVESTVVAASEM